MNKIILTGRVGNDPVITTSQNGTKLTFISIATNKFNKTQDGTYKNETVWHRVSVFGTTADFCVNNVNKGSLVSIEGELTYYENIDSISKEKYMLPSIRAIQLELLSKKNIKEVEEQKENITQNNENINQGNYFINNTKEMDETPF